jgi:hypothetical protein
MTAASRAISLQPRPRTIDCAALLLVVGEGVGAVDTLPGLLPPLPLAPVGLPLPPPPAGLALVLRPPAAPAAGVVVAGDPVAAGAGVVPQMARPCEYTA